jgi:nitrite reductase (NO-forming)
MLANVQPRLAAAALAGCVLAGGCGGGEASRPAASQTGREIAIIAGETREDGEKGGYALIGGEITSDPGPTIRVNVGQPVKISFDNVHGVFHGENWIPHDFVVVADKGIEVPLSPGDALWGAQTKELSPDDPVDVVTFTPDRPGTYHYICSVPGHVGRGMWGKFIVVE